MGWELWLQARLDTRKKKKNNNNNKKKAPKKEKEKVIINRDFGKGPIKLVPIKYTITITVYCSTPV
jgi:hypothetical protein